MGALFPCLFVWRSGRMVSLRGIGCACAGWRGELPVLCTIPSVILLMSLLSIYDVSSPSTLLTIQSSRITLSKMNGSLIT